MWLVAMVSDSRVLKANDLLLSQEMVVGRLRGQRSRGMRSEVSKRSKVQRSRSQSYKFRGLSGFDSQGP